MKINDVILTEADFQSLYNKPSLGQKILKFMNFGLDPNGQSSNTFSSSRAAQDNEIRLLVDAFLAQWDRMRYSQQQAHGANEVSESYYRELLEKLVYNQLNASYTKKVENAVNDILELGDNLNNQKAQNAAFVIITSGISSQMSPTLGPKVDVLNRKLANTPYGGKFGNQVPRVKGLIVPVIILNYGSTRQRLVKFNNIWYNMNATEQNGVALVEARPKSRRARSRRPSATPQQPVTFIFPEIAQSSNQFIFDERLIIKDPSVIHSLGVISDDQLAAGNTQVARRTAIQLLNDGGNQYRELTVDEIASWKETTGHR